MDELEFGNQHSAWRYGAFWATSGAIGRLGLSLGRKSMICIGWRRERQERRVVPEEFPGGSGGENLKN